MCPKAQNLAKNKYGEEWVLPVASAKESEEKKCVVDSETCMHMVVIRDLNSAE